MAWYINGHPYRGGANRDDTTPPATMLINPPCAVCGADQTHLIVLRDGPDTFVHGLCDRHYDETDQASREAAEIAVQTGDPQLAGARLAELAIAHWAEHEAIFGLEPCRTPWRFARQRRHRSHEAMAWRYAHTAPHYAYDHDDDEGAKP